MSRRYYPAVLRQGDGSSITLNSQSQLGGSEWLSNGTHWQLQINPGLRILMPTHVHIFNALTERLLNRIRKSALK